MPRVLEEAELSGSQLAVIRQKGAWLLVASVMGAVAGAVIGLMQPTVYEAVATLMVAQPKFSVDAKPISVSNFRALLQTNTLAIAEIKRFGLDTPPYNMTPGSFQRDALIIEEVRNTNFIRARARLTDKKKVADLANFLASEAVVFNERIDVQESAYYRSQLKTQVDDASARLRVSEGRLLAFRKTAQLDLVKRDADSALDERGELLRLTMDIESEKARLATAEQEIKRQDRILSVPRNTGADAALRATAAEIAEREAAAAPPAAREPAGKTDAKSDSREGERPPTSPDERRPPRPPTADVADGAHLDSTNPFINPVYQVLDYQIALGRTRLAGLERRRTELMTVLHLGGKELEALSRLYPQQIELRRLEAEHEITSTLYSEVTQQYERARLQMASNSARLQVVDIAVEPDGPLPRHRGLYTLLGLVLGVAVGMLAAVVVHASATSPARDAVHSR
jgi:hypothetical protein